MDIIQTIATEFNIRISQVEAVIKLLKDGNTIPFIARYRKEMTGSLDDELLRDLSLRLEYLNSLEERRKTVLKTISEQGLLTPELEEKINVCTTMTELEDLYRPYKPKKKTRATMAKEKGLMPLAQYILEQVEKTPLQEFAKQFISEEKGVPDVEEALKGASDIIAEIISDEAEYRKKARFLINTFGKIQAKEWNRNENGIFDMYKDYQESISRMAAHRVLAINRGEATKALKVSLLVPEEDILAFITRKVILPQSTFKNFLEETIKDAYDRLIFPSIETEIRNEMTEKAEESSLTIFEENIRQLLLVPPMIGKTVLGLDPAFRTGCKLCVVDKNGKVLAKTVIYPTPPHNRIEEGAQVIKKLIAKYGVDMIAIGNGTASRESEVFVRDLLKDVERKVIPIIVSEAGASVYSASKLGTKEFPDYDVAERSAVSIARRLQDPLAELVKIDPKSIGVGQYQHDMNQKRLGEALHGTVESVVNGVGVDLNTASPSLLEYISGITPTLAQSIVKYREDNGEFVSRADLLKVAKLGPKAFEQCAGFLRIRNQNILDNTGVHPESYKATLSLLRELKINLVDINKEETKDILSKIKCEEFAKKLGIGEPTLKDIINELLKPGRDPRLEAVTATLRNDVMELKDLKEGMILNGTVRNIMDFGVFVDIGVHQDGLVHISEMSNIFIKHPLDVVRVNDIVKVKVIGVDFLKKRISLSIKQAK